MARIAYEFTDEPNISKCLNCPKPECDNCLPNESARTYQSGKRARRLQAQNAAVEQAYKRGFAEGYRKAMEALNVRNVSMGGDLANQ